jgi:hypothetical protein
MTAIEQYMDTQAMISEELLKLQDKLANHLEENCVRINWAHVGDMTHILAQLKQLTEEEE